MQPAATKPQTNWTVIPRGIENNKFSFAVFVTPNQEVDTTTVDQNFWDTWLTKAVPAIINKGGTLNVAISGQPTKSIPFAFRAPTGDAAENTKAWAALLAYVPPPPQLQSHAVIFNNMSASLTESSGPQARDAHDLVPMTSPLHDLVGHIGKLNTAHTYAAVFARRSTAAPEMRAAAQSVVHTTIQRLSILKPRSDKARHEPSRAAIEFQNWLKGLVSQGGKEARVARLAERNLYRLSDAPYLKLNDKVFDVIRNLLGLHRQPGRPGDGEDPLNSFVELAIFHKRCQPKRLGTAAPPSARPMAAPATTIPNLFRALSALASYPEWLIRLGFGYEIEIVAPVLSDQTILSITSPLDGQSSVQVSCTSQGYPRYISPPISVQPQPVTYQFSKGYLVLGGCDLIINDLDGEGLRTIQYANSLAAATAQTPPPASEGDPPDPPITDNATGSSALPSRSMGISLVHPDTASHLKERLRRYDELNQSTAPALGLNDLIRGFTPELSTDGKNWLSLTQRRVAYDVSVNPPDCSTISERDFIFQPDAPLELGTATHSDTPAVGNPASGAVLNHHTASTLFRWEGWGLSVPSPYPVSEQGYPVISSPPSVHFPIAACYQPLNHDKNGFPRLRFGKTYYFRVCPLDLLSHRMGSVDSGTPSTAVTERSIEYLRYDPIPAPELLLDGTLDPVKYPGETLNCLVVRDNDTDHQPMRCLVPPVAGFDLIVQHGKLDSDAIFTENGFKKFGEIESFDDVFIEQDGTFPKTNIPSITNGKKTMYDVPVYRPGVAQPTCAYLPDPMALSVVPEFIDLADQTNTVIDGFDSQTFYVDDGNGPREWPHAKRLRLLVQTFDAGLPKSPQATWQWDNQNKISTLNVTIPKAWQVKLLLRCVPGEDNASKFFAAPSYVESFGKDFLSALKQSSNGSSTVQNLTRADVAKALANGALPQVTPAREIVIISAVRKPLAQSHIEQKSIIIQQTYDSPIVDLSFIVDIGDRRSTGKLEIIANWTDSTDDGSSAGGLSKPVPNTSHVAQYSLNTQNTNTTQPFTNVKQTFPDTRWRSVSLSVDSVSRFMHYYRDDASETDFITPDAQPQTITVLSTSRPDPLRVVKIIPLLSTQSRDVAPDVHFHKRLGGAFRIYVDRPWDSSGPNELLAIALWGEKFDLSQPACYDSADKFVPCAYQSWYADPTLEPYVTRWGADPAWLNDAQRPDDPIWEPSVTRLAPLSGAFKIPPASPDESLKRADVRKCAFPVEISLGTLDTQPSNIDPTQHPYVTLVTYPIQWDGTQKLWYSDILIEDAPPCFIRLALMRYQPQSLINRECSPIVIAPFALIGHERSVYLQKKPDGKLELQIYGAPRFVNSTRKKSYFQVELQYQEGHTWKPTSPDQQPIPEPISTNPISSDNLYSLLASFSMAVATPYNNKRVIIREFQSWFADDPARRSMRLERDQLANPPIMLRLPEFD
jgi:hypothetical protein